MSRVIRQGRRALVTEGLTKIVGLLLLGLVVLVLIGWWAKVHGL